MPLIGAGVGQMNRKRSKRKKEDDIPVYGSMKYAIRAGVKDPREVYRMKLEQQIQRRNAKRMCVVCGKKAQYEDKKFLKKPVFYCERCKNNIEKGGK